MAEGPTRRGLLKDLLVMDRWRGSSGHGLLKDLQGSEKRSLGSKAIAEK